MPHSHTSHISQAWLMGMMPYGFLGHFTFRTRQQIGQKHGTSQSPRRRPCRLAVFLPTCSATPQTGRPGRSGTQQPLRRLFRQAWFRLMPYPSRTRSANACIPSKACLQNCGAPSVALCELDSGLLRRVPPLKRNSGVGSCSCWPRACSCTTQAARTWGSCRLRLARWSLSRLPRARHSPSCVILRTDRPSLMLPFRPTLRLSNLLAHVCFPPHNFWHRFEAPVGERQQAFLGATNEHLRIFLDDEEDGRLLHVVAERVAQTDVPPLAFAALRVGRMVALRKSGGGVRVLVVGDVLGRLTGRFLAQAYATQLQQACLPFQRPLHVCSRSRPS